MAEKNELMTKQAELARKISDVYNQKAVHETKELKTLERINEMAKLNDDLMKVNGGL